MERGRLRTADNFLSRMGGMPSGPTEVLHGKLFNLSNMVTGSNEQEESWDAANGSVKNKTLAKSGSRGFDVDNDNSGGAIMLNFHF